MSASSPGLVRRILRGTWRVVDVSRRIVLNLIFLLILAIVVVALGKSGPKPLASDTALVLDLSGTIGEQRAGNFRSTALDQLRGDTVQKVQLRDVLAVLETAAKDDNVKTAVLILDEMDGTGLATLREIGLAIDRFKAGGKKVVAWGSSYDQRQYLLAAHADEIYLHPFGAVNVTGFGGVRNYYKDALDKLGVSVKVMRAGAFKDFGEPWVANAPSPASREAETALLGSLWKTYTDDIEKLRKLPAGSVMRSIDEAPARLAAVDGDRAKLALADKAVDGLKTRDELRALLVSRGAEDTDNKTFRQVGFEDYLSRVKPRIGVGSAIGIVVAEGEIVDGQAPAGTVGGVSTANLVRKARNDADIKAVVLRVNSPGGSVFGSELVRRELELTRKAGKPVVVSMGDTAASGGYWISTASDEIIADAATVTGSIGVIAVIPNAAGSLDKLGIHSTPIATTWLRAAGDPRVPFDPRLLDIIQRSIDHSYRDFTGRVAEARKTTPEKIDAVAQGRVWSGTQALERGLVDKVGSFTDAVASAGKRANLGEAPRVVYIERDPGAFGRFVSLFNAEVSSALGGAVGNAIDDKLGGFGALQPALAPVRELGWLSGLAERKEPFSAVAHCLCRAPL